MSKSKYIVAVVLILAAISLYFFRTDAEVIQPATADIPIRKELTAFDSLFFRYDNVVHHKLDSVGSVGAAMVITYKGELALLKCYGVKSAGGRDSINRNTIFRLASVSKTITGVLAGILSDEDIIGLDDKVVDYLPNFKLRDSINTYELSIRNILSHTSGLVPHAYDNLVEAQVPFSVIIDSLQRVNISGVPGKLYGYQNVVFSLYDTITKIRTASSFEQELKEKVFTPFGMTNASAGFEGFEENPNKAYPHARSRGSYKTLRLNDRYYNTKPAAGINASISDMGNFLLAFSTMDSSALKQDVAETVLHPQVISPLRWNYLRKWDRVDSKHYALGWRVFGYKGRTVAYHGGYVQGYRAEIALCQEEELGIAFLSNSPNGIESTIVPYFLNAFFELKDGQITE
jgi:beta-lactamase class C